MQAFEMKVGGKFTRGAGNKFRVVGEPVFSADDCYVIVPVESENVDGINAGMLALNPYAVVEDYVPPRVESVGVPSVFGEQAVRFSWRGDTEWVTIANYRTDVETETHPISVVVVDMHDLRAALEEFGLYGERG